MCSADTLTLAPRYRFRSGSHQSAFPSRGMMVPGSCRGWFPRWAPGPRAPGSSPPGECCHLVAPGCRGPGAQEGREGTSILEGLKVGQRLDTPRGWHTAWQKQLLFTLPISSHLQNGCLPHWGKSLVGVAPTPPGLIITNSWSSLNLTSIKSVMPSSHLILCRPLLLLPPTAPIRTEAG